MVLSIASYLHHWTANMIRSPVHIEQPPTETVRR